MKLGTLILSALLVTGVANADSQSWQESLKSSKAVSGALYDSVNTAVFMTSTKASAKSREVSADDQSFVIDTIQAKSGAIVISVQQLGELVGGGPTGQSVILKQSELVGIQSWATVLAVLHDAEHVLDGALELGSKVVKKGSKIVVFRIVDGALTLGYGSVNAAGQLSESEFEASSITLAESVPAVLEASLRGTLDAKYCKDEDGCLAGIRKQD